MKKIILIILLITISIFSYSYFGDQSIQFELTNNSDKPITNICFITSYDSIMVDKLNTGEVLSKSLKYTSKRNEESGYYNVTFYRNDTLKEESFCYEFRSIIKEKKIVKFSVTNSDIIRDFTGVECF
jgi:hypothetical protein